MASRTPPGYFNILYFAAASSFTKKSSEQLKSPVLFKDLFNVLEDQYPGFKKAVLNSCAVTINLNYVDIDEAKADGGESTESTIHDGDEVAIIPPVSSG